MPTRHGRGVTWLAPFLLSTMGPAAFPRARTCAALVLSCCCLGIVTLPTSVKAADVMEIGDEGAFEEQVISSSAVWVVGFVSGNERSEQMADALQHVADTMLDVRVGAVDISEAKAVGYEFGVRKRTAPKAAVFLSRSRNAVELTLPEDPIDAAVGDALVTEVRGLLERDGNEIGQGGEYQKITLAVGGTGEWAGDDADL